MEYFRNKSLVNLKLQAVLSGDGPSHFLALSLLISLSSNLHMLTLLPTSHLTPMVCWVLFINSTQT